MQTDTQSPPPSSGSGAPNDEEGIRLARRREWNDDVILRDPDGHGEVRLRGRDVSVAGLFVYSPAAVPEGMEFICALPTNDGLVEARGRVARVELDADDPASTGLGIAFTELHRESRDWILAYTRCAA